MRLILSNLKRKIKDDTQIVQTVQKQIKGLYSSSLKVHEQEVNKLDWREKAENSRQSTLNATRGYSSQAQEV